MREEGGGRISESYEKAKSCFSQLADVSFGPAVVEVRVCVCVCVKVVDVTESDQKAASRLATGSRLMVYAVCVGLM